MITRRIVTRLLATATVVSAMTLTVLSGTASALVSPHIGGAGSPTLAAADVDAHAVTEFGAVDVAVRTRAGTDQPPSRAIPGWIADLRSTGVQVSQAVRLLRG
ncbi:MULTISPECIES: hypothetical protein [Lentzea]|uniref:Uncharacterized protein n=2 Tax=Lentzea TaxID=165301 RepID=A0A1W2DCL8_9PSEU|nr:MULTISPECIES: hypothetical protein [Lentzea]MDX8140532.1 hypothetical protein [Lentzea sp. BCCO 10_0061]SMC95181.1 hypothetical protein SAMN05660733_02875 [Lentzea albidocapillata]